MNIFIYYQNFSYKKENQYIDDKKYYQLFQNKNCSLMIYKFMMIKT
jgi:hypothetical protein